MRLLTTGMPYSRSISSPAATRRPARRQILSYALRPAASRSGCAQSRRDMPIVMVRMSRFSICTMRMVSTISCGENGSGMAASSRRSDAMHVLEDVLVLGVDLHAHLFAFLGQPALQLV